MPRNNTVVRKSKSMKSDCTIGRLPISAATERELFSRSAGHCQRPECNRSVFVDLGERSVTIGEMAHIIAAEESGPRADTTVTRHAKAGIDNLILLCANCHTLVDKAPETFDVDLIRNWKRAHEGRIESLFGTRLYQARPEVRGAIEPRLAQNRALFRSYGPSSARAQSDALGESAAAWSRHVLETMLPNNRAILSLLDRNRYLLTLSERDVLEQYRIHVSDFEARHLLGAREADAALFPAEMETILT